MAAAREKQVTMKAVAERAGVSISTVSMALADHPRIGAATKRRGHRVALYVSEMPKDARERKSLPNKLEVPESDMEVDIEILEIGEVEQEESRGAAEPTLGKEPL